MMTADDNSGGNISSIGGSVVECQIDRLHDIIRLIETYFAVTRVEK